MSGDTKRVLEVNQIDNLQGSTQRVKQETTLNNLRGITQRVYVVGGGGSTPVIDELNVTPSTSAQTITAPSGVDGYSPVNVSAVTSAIDANITAENIKKDVEILGVTGSYEGQTPTGTMYIISNGTYNVADKAIANVNVPTTAPAHYVEKTVDANGKLVNSTNVINLNGATDVKSYVLCGQYYGVNFPSNTSVDLSSLTTLSGQNACYSMFQNCTGIISVDLSSLTSVSADNACQNMFYGSNGLTSVDLRSLTTVSAQNACSFMFSSCSSITSVNLDLLTTVSGINGCSSMFVSCTGITSIDLSSLTTISATNGCNNMFASCSGITSVNLSSLTTISGVNGCYNMFSGVNRLTSVDLSSLTTVSGANGLSNTFSGCTNLATFKANKLNVVSAQISPSYGPVFAGCTKLESVELGGLTASTFASAVNQIQYLFNAQTGSQATGGCTVHFPSNFDPSEPDHTFDVTTLTGYPTFGGSASYIHVAFDLPATE